jgi:hypothetical protein
MRTAVIEVRGALVDFAKPTAAVSFELPVGLRDLVQSQGVPHVEVAAVTVDGREVPWSHRIRGDEHIVVEPRYPLPGSLLDPRFALDGHLGTLARDLRLLGFDSWYQRTVDDADLVSMSVESGRMLLSRDLGVLMRSAVANASYVRATDPDEQIVEVLARFGLGEKVQPFRRCLACNGLLVNASAAQVAANVDARIAAQFSSFRHCPDCGRTYWEGSHYERLAARVEGILRSAPIRAVGERPRPADPRSRPAG